jgi:hypothetical protein
MTQTPKGRQKPSPLRWSAAVQVEQFPRHSPPLSAPGQNHGGDRRHRWAAVRPLRRSLQEMQAIIAGFHMVFMFEHPPSLPVCD